MKKLAPETRALILSALTDGMGVNATARLAGVSKLTVLRLLADAGTLALDYHDLMVRKLPTARVEVDELWSFVGGKEKTKAAGSAVHGDAWVWVAIDSDHKLAISYHVGDRDLENATVFMKDVASRLTRRVQLTSDGHSAYPQAVEAAFGGNVDYAQLIKEYATDRAGEARYSPPKCTGCTERTISGNPDPDLISTSYVERSNLSTRVSAKRFARLTNCYSRILSNHVYAVALTFLAYNFMKKHATLKTTPAVAAGIMAKPMTMLDFVHLLEREEALRGGGRISGYQPARKKARAE